VKCNLQSQAGHLRADRGEDFADGLTIGEAVFRSGGADRLARSASRFPRDSLIVLAIPGAVRLKLVFSTAAPARLRSASDASPAGSGSNALGTLAGVLGERPVGLAAEAFAHAREDPRLPLVPPPDSNGKQGVCRGLRPLGLVASLRGRRSGLLKTPSPANPRAHRT
jgi:hypothetical protein